MKTNDELIQSLRADLSATNSALIAMLSTMSPLQRQQVLTAFSAESARKQSLVEQMPNGLQRDLVQQLQAAEARLFEGLQGTHRLQASKEP